ncbi:titin homolog isoform X2 [Cylas formicarius]|uniref:titin homolog isoform X2 n=1 Tax=Cylas formicarius TaxID=197179 RepID=UPI00295885C5|nr:titin homolog isoform X2 [Cylas formicarius]
MGNTQAKPHPRSRNKKQVHWKAADRPAPPGKPQLISDAETLPDLITIRWGRPPNDGGSPISSYLVEHRRVGSPHWVRATPLPVLFPELTLSGLEPGWRYQFRVRAENAVGYSDPGEVSDAITVTLQRSAVTAPKFTQEVQDTVALENDKCEFVVHFMSQPAPRICWFKDGFEIFSSRRIRILTENDRSVLTIHQTSLSDEGEIKCTATNKAGHVSTKAKLTVEAPPSIRLPRQYEEGLLFEIGEIIRLKVSVVGRPVPLAFWTHNGESIHSDDRYEIEYADRSFSLKIADASRSDRGEYQVKAVNKLGENTASFLVTVTDKPSRPGRARVVMTLGKSVTLSWTMPEDDGGCKIGNYIVEYYRLGWDVWLKAATCRQLTTILGDLIEGSEYKFRIKAESPYGISEPSEESDTVFIPDPKRGMVHPPLRGRSQPKDVTTSVSTPVAAKRTRKRSQSSSRTELSESPPEVPVRPERYKIKSPPKTPEMSPMLPRKDNSQINRTIIDRASIARELAYGSPEIRVKKESVSPQPNISKSTTPSQDRKIDNADHKIYKVKIEPPMDESKPELPPKQKSPSPEPKKKLIREHSATVSGSSEFMLVLYSDENEKGQSDMFNFDENCVPPPLSLSAPELGADPPQLYPIKNSASSTELLHTRAMMRFYQAAEAEDAELTKIPKAGERRKLSLDIPRIQINSKDEEEIVGLERKYAVRRKSSTGSLGQQHALWAQRRHSLKSSTELKENSIQSNLKHSPNTQLSSSRELEEEQFEKIRQKTKLESQASFEKKAVTIAEEARWMEEYEESLSESSAESTDSETERFKFNVMTSKRIPQDEGFEDEDDTYHPSGSIRTLKKKDSEPFQILTKRKEPPDPSFVPKPILKKADYDVSPLVSPSVSPPTSPVKVARSLSPRPDIVLQRNRSKSLAIPVLSPLSSSNEEINEIPYKRGRSLSLTTNKLPEQKDFPKPQKKTSSALLSSISKVAEISGITAASIVIPEKLLERRKDAEEAKVVADHYGDIVRNYGQRRKSSPQIYLNRDDLKKAAANLETPQEEELSSKEEPSSKENLSNDSGYQSGYKMTNFTDHFRPPTNAGAASVIQKPVTQTNHEAEEMVSRGEQTQIQETSTRGSIQLTIENSSKGRKSSPSPLGRRAVTRSKSPSKRSTSVTRKPFSTPAAANPLETMKKSRKTSPSPRRKIILSPSSSESPSPTLFSRKPKLKEIMTQTSVGLESSSAAIDNTDDKIRRDVLMAKAEVKVRGLVDYLTDLAMLAVACWLYFYKNELLAIPVLLIMMYRQLKCEIGKRIPNWLTKRLKKKQTESGT